MRVGRGIGSGKGKTCGRGGKGQTARSGVAIKGFEGGQTPIHRRLPKRGFNNPLAAKVQTVNLWEIEAAIESGKLKAADVNINTLKEAGILRGQFCKVKLLGKGEAKSKINITVDLASSGAVEAIEKSGGKVSLSGVTPIKKAEKTAEPKAEKAEAKKTTKKAEAKSEEKPAKKASTKKKADKE